MAAFYPIIQDVDALELRIFAALDEDNAVDVQDAGSKSDPKQPPPAEVALYLAALGVGVQFCTLPSNERARQSLDFGKLYDMVVGQVS